MKNLDEYSQYGAITHIISWDGSLRETLNQAIHYNYYYYGYFFFIVSVIAITPIHVLHSLGIHFSTFQIDLLILRELSVLFMLASIWIITYLLTGFQRFWPTVLIFVFLETMPAVVGNNMWWHPESLTIFFIVLTIFALNKDALQFKKWFYFSAIFCGIAIGTKFIAAFFFITIPSYLLYGILKKRVTFVRAIRLGGSFCILMGMTLLATNPLLGTRAGFNTYYSLLQYNSEQMKAGWNIKQEAGIVPWYVTVLRHEFAYAWTIFFAVSLCIWGLIQKKQEELRLASLTILTWSLTYGLYVLFTVASKLSKYILPAMLPLLAAVAIGYNMLFAGKTIFSKKIYYYLMLAIVVFISASQIWLIHKNIQLYSYEYSWEERSEGIAFYHNLYAAELHNEKKTITIYRDWSIYVPDNPMIIQKTKNGVVNYVDIQEWKPDYILLEHSTINGYANNTADFVDAAGVERAKKFYVDVEQNKINGYQRVFSDEFGVAFKKITE